MGAPRRFTHREFEKVRHLSPAEQARELGCSLRTVQRHYAGLRDTTPTILDPASGARTFYFDPDDERVVFGDIRTESHLLSDGRVFEIRPDVQLDFRSLPYDDGTFRMVVFDPPHLLWAGKRAWLAKRYGKLDRDSWRDDLRRGLAECFRVLDPGGTLVFKWSETDIPLREVLRLTPERPVLGHRSGKHARTHWVLFLKASDA